MARLALQALDRVRPVRTFKPEEDGTVLRDPTHETHLVQIAAISVGLGTDDNGSITLHPSADFLDKFAKSRALPGPVQMDNRDLMHEAIEELADCRNYLVWHIQAHLEGALHGTEEHAEEYERGMRGLAALLVLNDAIAPVA